MRIKRGKTKKQKHSKILKKAKGYRLSYSKLYKRAREALMHAGQYAYAHRKKRAGDMREIWIERINGALHTYNLSYSKFINLLKTAKIGLNRKMLAELAVNEPDTFKAVVEKVQMK
jgi:large subunit ribosomal protein L20